jgi:hypothetical protein
MEQIRFGNELFNSLTYFLGPPRVDCRLFIITATMANIAMTVTPITHAMMIHKILGDLLSPPAENVKEYKS